MATTLQGILCPSMFDSHCHLDFESFEADRAALWRRCRELGVTSVHVPGVSPEQWPRAASMRSLGQGVGCGVGVHPWWIERLTANELRAALDGLSAAVLHHRAEAIGECGLDGAVAKRGGPDLMRQSEVLDAHLEVARALERVVVLHVVAAHGRALEVLEAHGPFSAGVLLHSYSGSAELVPRYLAVGCSFSFGGIVTRESARRPLAAARAVPLERLLIESDGPDQPLAGRARSAPDDLPTICAALARVRSAAVDELGERTAANAVRLFGRGG
jgi:TatD DNase family protein